jgi:hypothetical protein
MRCNYQEAKQNGGPVSGSFICRHVLRRAIADGLHPFMGVQNLRSPGAVLRRLTRYATNLG